MPRTHLEKGGESIQLLPEVVVHEQLVDRETAEQAARTVLRLIRSDNPLAFINQVRNYDEGKAPLWMIGCWSLGQGFADEGSMWHPDNLKKINCAALIRTTHALMDFAGLTAIDYLHVMIPSGGARAFAHQDLGDYERSLLMLCGAKVVKFPDTEGNELDELLNSPEVYQLQGDAYKIK